MDCPPTAQPESPRAVANSPTVGGTAESPNRRKGKDRGVPAAPSSRVACAPSERALPPWGGWPDGAERSREQRAASSEPLTLLHQCQAARQEEVREAMVARLSLQARVAELEAVSTLFAIGSPLPLWPRHFASPCVSTAVVAKTLTLPCVSAAVVAKPLPFLAVLRRRRRRSAWR